MRKDINYSPSDCFETFPFPDLDGLRIANGTCVETLQTLGETYHAHRAAVCVSRTLGLTKVYNLFHDARCADADIVELRRLHVALDTAVAAAYGWQDVALRHGFYGDGKDCRYTLHPDAKSEALRRLLALNHVRYAEEVAAGLHEKGKAKPKGAKPKSAKAPPAATTGDALAAPRRSLFDDQLTLGEVS
jgi:hypothetical protein